MIEEHDPDLYRLDIRFHKALSENRYETAKRIFRSIKAHKPDDGLIETIITVI